MLHIYKQMSYDNNNSDMSVRTPQYLKSHQKKMNGIYNNCNNNNNNNNNHLTNNKPHDGSLSTDKNLPRFLNVPRISSSSCRRNSDPVPQAPAHIIISGETNKDKKLITNKILNTEHMKRQRSASVLEVKDSLEIQLREELLVARQELEMRIAKNEELERNQERMNGEVTELTASLFEEANKMVQDAHVKRIQAENELKCANNTIEMLKAEVKALKALVITSTPSTPNKHLHPQLDSSSPTQSSSSASSSSCSPAPQNTITTIVNKPIVSKLMKKPLFVKTHRRSTSHHQFTRDDATNININVIPPPTTVSNTNTNNEEQSSSSSSSSSRNTDEWDVDPIYFDEFINWKTTHKLDDDSKFLQRIIKEDIFPCLDFINKDLSKSIHQSIKKNKIAIEPVAERNPIPQMCSLTERNNVCKYRVKLSDTEEWHFVSKLARNRIAAAADFYTYLSYIALGLVKSSDIDMFQHIMKLRNQMCKARLGFSI